jgi:hypothetical protein
MPFPVAAAVVYGAVAGGGMAGAAAALQRLYRYLTSDGAEQDAQDAQLTPTLQAVAAALAQAKFGMPILDLSPDDRRAIETEANVARMKFAKELNDASKYVFGKPSHA